MNDSQSTPPPQELPNTMEKMFPILSFSFAISSWMNVKKVQCLLYMYSDIMNYCKEVIKDLHLHVVRS